MQRTEYGWVIINKNHPNTGRQIVAEYTFSRTRTEAINKFLGGTKEKWRYWREKFNYRCVKAEQTITTIEDDKSN